MREPELIVTSVDFARRALLKLAGVATAAAALPGAIRAEGGVSPSVVLPFALTTPVSVGKACLRVRDLPVVRDYYRTLLGFEVVAKREGEVDLGVGGVALLTLRQVADIAPESPVSAGLYHIAYLMPSRADLGRWLVHAVHLGVRIDGFADHNVSEAVYLTDPEGNGIEVYADRPAEQWVWHQGFVTMGSRSLDVDGLFALADSSVDTYKRIPEALRIGHIHLRVGDLEKANEFYSVGIGLTPTKRGRKDAAFLSSGGYHHHVAMNVWQSEGAGARDPNTTGLDWFSLEAGREVLAEIKASLAAADIDATSTGGSLVIFDPWGTEVRIAAKA